MSQHQSNGEIVQPLDAQQRQQLGQIIDQHFVAEVEFLQRLVRAKSANSYTIDTSPTDVPVEAEVAAIIHEQMRHFGWPSQLIGVAVARPNVFCHLPGPTTTDGKTLILNTHMDTVPASAAYTRDPWSADLVEGRLYGLGAADAKAQIAAFLYAVRALQLAGIQLAGTLKLAFVVDEETGACSPYGTRYLLEQGLLDGDAALIGEPGDEQVAIGHRGLYRFRIRTRGRAMHTGSRTWEEKTGGHNAILDMTHIIQALSTWELPSAPSAAFPRRKNVLTFPTLIQGGSGINIVPEACEAYGDTRLLPGVTAAMVKASIEQHLKPLWYSRGGVDPHPNMDSGEVDPHPNMCLGEVDPHPNMDSGGGQPRPYRPRAGSLPYELQEIIFVPAVEIAADEWIVQALSRSIEDITGTRPPLKGVGPACDGWMFVTRGIPSICGYGVACGGVHGADEWIELASLRRLTEIYATTIVAYLGQS